MLRACAPRSPVLLCKVKKRREQLSSCWQNVVAKRSSERDAVRVADARRPRGSCLAPCVRTTTVTSATQSASSTSGQASKSQVSVNKFFPPPENSVFRKGKPHQINLARTRNGNVSLGPPKNARPSPPPASAPPTASDVAATVQSGMVSRAARFLPKAALRLPVVFRTHAGTLDPMRARLVFLTHADR